jgi:DNA polymerase/3'-5' exonuclease PolX
MVYILGYWYFDETRTDALSSTEKVFHCGTTEQRFTSIYYLSRIPDRLLGTASPQKKLNFTRSQYIKQHPYNSTLQEMDYRAAIIDALDTLRKRDVADKQPFKAKAYQKVIAQLQTGTSAIHSWEDLKTVEGVGEKIRKKIDEIFATGVLASAERTKASGTLSALEAFQGIYGVGPAKASALVKAGIKTVEDLRSAAAADPSILNTNQTLGLHYYEDLLQRIPRVEMDEHAALLSKACPSSLTMDIVGSYRRGAASSGDIDVLLKAEGKQAGKAFLTMIENIKAAYPIVEILAQGPKKCMAIIKLTPTSTARRLDLLLTPAAEYAYALFYFTGSDKFNVAVRSHALTLGYSLNEHSLSVVESSMPAPPPMESEEDIFGFLCLKYIPPTERVDAGQVIAE